MRGDREGQRLMIKNGELAQLVERPDARGSGRSEVEAKIMGN